MSWDFIYRGETECLDDATRAALGGSFVRLTGGYTHYELEGSKDGRFVALIHGFSAGYFVWDHTFMALVSAGLRVL